MNGNGRGLCGSGKEGMGGGMEREGREYDAFSRKTEKRRQDVFFSLQASLRGLTGRKSSRRLARWKEDR